MILKLGPELGSLFPSVSAKHTIHNSVFTLKQIHIYPKISSLYLKRRFCPRRLCNCLLFVLQNGRKPKRPAGEKCFARSHSIFWKTMKCGNV